MRTLIKNILIVMVAAFTLNGCMQHNGRIGDWFGFWKLESITVDGIDDQAYTGNIFFKFQSDIVEITEVYESQPGTHSDSFGRWSEEGTTLTLDFSFAADGSANSHFNPLPATLLKKGINILNIDSKSSSRMQWTMQTADPDHSIVYTLKKQ